MIIQVIAEEFPEFLLPVAEENFIRGYQQAINDTVKNTPGIKKNEGIHSRKLT